MTNKLKNIWLITGFIVGLVICYHLAIKKTLLLRSSYNSLSKDELSMKDIPRQLSILKQKEVYYDSVFDKYQLNGGSLQNNLLKTINSYAESNDLKIIDFIEPHMIVQNGLTVKTYQFGMEGNYNSIIGLIHKLEQETKFGEIINLDFEKKKNFRTGRDYLVANVLIKSFG